MKTKILLVGIDGLILRRALESGKATTLSALKETGHFTELTMSVPTLSGPGWSTLLTGSTHSEHSVKDNEFGGHNLLHRPDLLTRAFYQDQSTTTFAAAGWPPLIDPSGIGPVIQERREQQRANKHRLIVRDGETYGYQRVDSEIADAAVYAVAKAGPDVSFVYFCDVDEAGHLHGSSGEQYVAAIERVDSHLSRLHTAVTNRVSEHGENWLMVVTTDHGHLDEGGHGNDSAQERASFVIAVGLGRKNPSWSTEFQPEELVSLLLAERS